MFGVGRDEAPDPVPFAAGAVPMPTTAPTDDPRHHARRAAHAATRSDRARHTPGDPDGEPQAPGAATAEEQPVSVEVSPAWELEMLIAGAVTFALFQVPGALDGALAWAEARGTTVPVALASMGYMYAKAIVYVLIASFLLNLTARAYWVGLVGRQSVIPGGVRWERLGATAGPFMVEEYRRRLASLPAVIARVDNFASVIFSFAFLVVLTFVVSVSVLALLGGAALLISRLAFGGRYVRGVGGTLALLLLLPILIAGTVDKAWGSRFAPDGRGARAMRRAVRFSAYVNGTAVFGPIFLAPYSNLRRRVMVPMFYGAVALALAIAAGETVARITGISAGGSAYMPDDPGPRGGAADDYESLRAPGASTTVPFIQSDVVDGPYVRLFIPYRADRHDAWLAASCPGAAPVRRTTLHLVRPAADPALGEARAAHALACLARLHVVAVDGRPVDGVELRFHTHPATGRLGLLAYIPTAPLGRGTHVLRVQPVPRARPSSRRPPPQPYDITFWI